MNFLAAVEAEIHANIAAHSRMSLVFSLGPSFFLARKIRKFPRAARKRRVVTKWRNDLLRRYGEWY